MPQFFQSVWRIAAADLRLARRFPRYGMAILAIALVPALYALIYLTSVWDPNANTKALPVAIVNLDVGLQYRGRTANLGAELTKGLMAAGTFGFQAMPDAQAARQAVRRGAVAFAIVVPADFSANAVPGIQPGAGKVTVILSEGNNYASAGFARRFAEDLGHQANEILNEQRWEQVLATADGSVRSLNDLRTGMAQLRAGLQSLEQDLNRNTALTAQWVAGVRKAEGELRGLDEKWAAGVDAKPLRSGIQRLAARQRELSLGLEQLRGGADRFADGAAALQERVLTSTDVDDRLPAGSSDLATGKSQLRDSLAATVESNARLGAGLARAEASVGKLVDGASGHGDALHGMVGKLQQTATLESPVNSARAIVQNVSQLQFGVDMAASALPATPGKPDGSARGLAESVEPQFELLAPVANNGSAFAPNMAAMALWLGAVMIVYVFPMQTLVAELAPRSPLARMLGKFLVPAGTAVAQVLLIVLTLVWGLGIPTPDPAGFMLILLLSAWAFLAIVYLLVRALGEAGKLIAVLLLTLQLAAGGGVLPIELSGGLFRTLHEWLPFTWVVRALRASLFGAYDAQWLQAVLIVAAVGCGSLLIAACVGRWKLVAQLDYRPPIEV